MLESLQARGQKVEALEKSPVLGVIENFYLKAFNFLSLSRQNGMSVGAIPLNEIVTYHEIFGSPHDVEKFAEIIRAIDWDFIHEQSNTRH